MACASVVGGKVVWPEREVCRAAFVNAYEASSPRRAAVVFRGESFRNVGGQHMRGTCCPLSMRNQRMIWDSHMEFFEKLRGMGFAVDVFSATRPCTSSSGDSRGRTKGHRCRSTVRGVSGDGRRHTRDRPLG